MWDESYEDYNRGPMRMRQRGMRGPRMMGTPRGGMRGRRPQRGGPRGMMGQMGDPMMETRGPRGPWPFGGGDEKIDPKFMKQCKLYLESIKKNIPTNKDNLSVYCVACSFLAKNNQEFFNHRNHVRHLRQMAKIDIMPQSIQKLVKDVIDQVHIERSDQKTLMFCDMCDEKLPIPYSDHKNIISHQLRSRAVRAGCIPCNTGSLENYPKYREHSATEEHIKKADAFLKDLDDQVESCKELKNFPPFKEGVLFGTKHVKKAGGYYCTLCRKYLPTDEEMEVHSRLQRHFNHVRDEHFSKKKKGDVDLGDYALPEEEKNEASEETNDTSNRVSDDKTEEAMETTDD